MLAKPRPTGASGQALLPGPEASPPPPPRALEAANRWVERVQAALSERSPDALVLVEQGLRFCPGEPRLLLLGALVALAGRLVGQAEMYLKRYLKQNEPNKPVALLTALVAAQRGRFESARATLAHAGIANLAEARASFIGDGAMADWLEAW